MPQTVINGLVNHVEYKLKKLKLTPEYNFWSLKLTREFNFMNSGLRISYDSHSLLCPQGSTGLSSVDLSICRKRRERKAGMWVGAVTTAPATFLSRAAKRGLLCSHRPRWTGWLLAGLWSSLTLCLPSSEHLLDPAAVYCTRSFSPAPLRPSRKTQRQ